MKALNIDAEIAQAIASGDASLVADNKFVDKDGKPVKVRSMEQTSDPLEVGDTFTVPVDYKVINWKFPSGDAYPCTLVTVKSADGSERNFRFFPNSLCKTVTPIVDGKRQAKVKTTGTATDLYKGFDTVDDGLDALRGKTITVVASETYTVRDYTTKTERDTHIYQYDLVP